MIPDLVLTAQDLAVGPPSSRGSLLPPTGGVHAPRGIQRLRPVEVTPSMSRSASGWTARVNRSHFRTRADARIAIVEYRAGCYHGSVCQASRLPDAPGGGGRRAQRQPVGSPVRMSTILAEVHCGVRESADSAPAGRCRGSSPAPWLPPKQGTARLRRSGPFNFPPGVPSGEGYPVARWAYGMRGEVVAVPPSDAVSACGCRTKRASSRWRERVATGPGYAVRCVARPVGA